MSLSGGAQVGRYQIVELLGAGGMGEVYRARDSKLNRDVALKVLPDSVAADRDRVARFEREAQIVASLNHPNIAHVHGFEETDGVSALAMELVEGPTLADRIAQGAVPLSEALAIARQIAEALEAAHEHGIVHRDLKPANVKVRPDGTVKVLDFGLAKAAESAHAPGRSASMSPTLSMHATQAGIILGTAGYMSPEQAAGKPVDRRADLWAFGVVLLEMLTGRAVFEGETVSHVLAAVLKDEPQWSALPADTPPGIQRLLQRCLQKDRKRRLDSAATARLEIDDAIAHPQAVAAPAVTIMPRRAWFPWAVAMAAILAAAVLGYSLLDQPASAPPLKSAFSIPLAPQLSGFAISPDGTRLVFSAPAEGRQQLFLRRLDDFTITVIAGAEGGTWPFWSPDSRHLGFFAQGKLKRIELASGRAQTLCDAELPLIPGATWSRNGTVLFITAAGMLMRVPANGGAPTEVETTPGERNTGYGRPQFLPDGERFIFFKNSDDANIRGMYVSTLGRAERTKLTDTRATFAPPDQLLVLAGERLVAQRLDPATAKLTGDPRPLLDDSPPALSASDNGVLVYRRLQSFSSYQLELADRSGKRVAVIGGQGDYYMPRLSPDGRKLAVEMHNDRGFGDLEIIDLARDASTRFTFKPTAHNAAATWSPAGDRLAYHSQGPDASGVFVKPASGLTEERRVLEQGSPTDWVAGDIIVFERRVDGRLGLDLW
jgi:Tol biopolymer transport system component/tRNA A-37 threonylcarbamoyl transferase component Bud32